MRFDKLYFLAALIKVSVCLQILMYKLYILYLPLITKCYFQNNDVNEIQDPVAVTETTLISSTTVCRNVRTGEYIYNMAVSAEGVIAYCKFKQDNQGTSALHSLHVVEDGVVRTVIPGTTDWIGGLTFLQIAGTTDWLYSPTFLPNAGREQLLMHQRRHIQLMSPDLRTVERRLQHLKHGASAPFCRSGENKALYVQRTEVQGEWEVRELEVTSDTHHDTQKAILTLEWKGICDMCIAEGFLIIVSKDNNDNEGVSGMSLSDWQVTWKMPVENALRVCPGSPGSVFVSCRKSHTIQQLSLRDGSVLTQLPLVPDVMAPTCVCSHNDTLYVAHEDAELWRTQRQRNSKISQYTFK